MLLQIQSKIMILSHILINGIQPCCFASRSQLMQKICVEGPNSMSVDSVARIKATGWPSGEGFGVRVAGVGDRVPATAHVSCRNIT